VEASLSTPEPTHPSCCSTPCSGTPANAGPATDASSSCAPSQSPGLHLIRFDLALFLFRGGNDAQEEAVSMAADALVAFEEFVLRCTDLGIGIAGKGNVAGREFDLGEPPP
jgi:hypothetical protein